MAWNESTDRGQPNTQSGGASDSGVATGLHESADTAREIAHTIEHGADALDKASRTTAAVAKKMERVTDKAASARDAVTERARAHPMAAVGVALALGFLAGRRR